MMERATLRVLPLLTLALATGCGSGMDEAGATADVEKQPVELLAADLARATLGSVADQVVLTGNLEPHRVVTLSAQVPGTVVALRADRGVRVTRGQSLALLEADGIRGMAEAAASQLAVAKQSLDGARTLYEAGAMSALDYEAAKAAYDGARASAAGASESARRATLISPLDGVVSARWASEGESLNPGQPVFTVVDTRVLELRGQLPVEAAVRVRPGQPVSFEVSGYPGRTFRGEVDRVEPTADPQTRQVAVYARLVNDLSMPGGMFARGRVDLERLESVVVVPRGAVRETAAGAVAYVLDGDRIWHRPIVVGPANAERDLVAVMEGLEPGERLVTTPLVQVVDGTPARTPGPEGEG